MVKGKSKDDLPVLAEYGGISPDEIAKAAPLIPPGEAGTPIETRFVRAVSDLITVRGHRENDAYSAFLLWRTTDRPTFKNVHKPLLVNGNDDVSGFIWIVSHNIGSTACRLPEKFEDQAELFASISAHGLHQLSAVVVDWRSGSPSVLFYPKGTEQLDHFEKIYLEETPIGVERLKEFLDTFYEEHLRTPFLTSYAHQQKIWDDAARGVPMHRPEECIHGRMYGPLKRAFPGHDVRSEGPTAEGRFDMSIYKHVRSEGGLPSMRTDWLLELKAICDKTSKGDPKTSPTFEEAAQSGVEQVMAYKSSLHPLQSALCCFDMTLNDEGEGNYFTSVKAIAQKEDINLWRWYLYRTAEAARQAKYGVTAA